MVLKQYLLDSVTTASRATYPKNIEGFVEGEKLLDLLKACASSPRPTPLVDDNIFISGASLGELTEAELKMVEEIRDVWKAILKVDDITDDTDFFSMGAGSMDVVRSGLTIAIANFLIDGSLS